VAELLRTRIELRGDGGHPPIVGAKKRPAGAGLFSKRRSGGSVVLAVDGAVGLLRGLAALGGSLVGGGGDLRGGVLGIAGDLAHGLAGGGGSGFGARLDHLAGGGNGVGSLGAGGVGGGSGLGGLLLGGRGLVLAGRQRQHGGSGNDQKLGVHDSLLVDVVERKSRRCRRLSVTKPKPVLLAVGVVLGVGRSSSFLGRVLRLLGGVGRVLGGIG